MKYAIILILTLFCSRDVAGQMICITHACRDTNYIKDFYTDYFIFRAYECTKFNNFKLINKGDKLVYKQNQHNDLGIGFNYKVLFLNIEFTIPFTEKNRDIYGTTHSFDVQTYFYVKKFVVDIYTQFYQGYYLNNGNQELSGVQTPKVILRPDIKTTDLDANVTYVLNNDRFSFNAPFTQNEIQKKSAGSILLGGGIYFSKGKADSSFIPSMMKNTDFFQGRRFNKFSYTSLGCNAGYAYTQVIRKHFYVMGALTGGPGIGYSVIQNFQTDQKDGKLGITYNASAKFAAGWSSDRYFAGITYLRLMTVNNSVAADTREEGNSGNFQFTVAQRFKLKKSLIPKSGVIRID